MPEQGDQSQGLYYPDGSFKSEKRIKVEAMAIDPESRDIEVDVSLEQVYKNL
jgi:hypothetical protein